MSKFLWPIGSFALGAFIIYTQFYQPWQAMRLGETNIDYSMKMQFFGPIALAGGIVLTVLLPEKPSATLNTLAIGIGIIGLVASIYLTAFWFPAQVEAFGYADKPYGVSQSPH